MLRKIVLIIILISVMLCAPFTVYAYEYDGIGFDVPGGYTETKNEYFFDPTDTYLILHKELIENPDYKYEIYAGSYVYLPVYVYPEGGNAEQPATDKLIKTDNVEISYTALRGGEHIGELTLIDAKKLKSSGLPAGIYVQIPLTGDYENITKSLVSLRIVLSVNGVSYQHTRIDFKCYLQNRVEEIRDNSVYGAKVPTQFKVSRSYNGPATFDFGDNIRYTVNVRQSAIYYMNLSREPIETIANMYADAYLDFYNFKGNKKSFESAGRLEIPVQRDKLAKNGEEASLYVYRVEGDTLQTLTNEVASFDMKTNKLTIRTKNPGQYVLSNRALMKTVDGEDENNILKSGYASTASPETSEISSESSSSISSAPESSPSQPGPASDPAQTETVSQDEDGYVPEEPWNNPNSNVQTGLPIRADNVSSDNPSTADLPFASAPVAGIIALLSSAAALLLNHKKRPS